MDKTQISVLSTEKVKFCKLCALSNIDVKKHCDLGDYTVYEYDLKVKESVLYIIKDIYESVIKPPMKKKKK